MYESKTVIVEGFEVVLDKNGFVVFKDKKIDPVNGFINLEDGNAKLKILLTKLFIDNFGVNFLNVFFKTKTDFVVIDELINVAYSEAGKFYNLQKLEEISPKGENLEVVEKKKAVKVSIKELYKKYFQAKNEAKEKMSKLILEAKEIRVVYKGRKVFYNGEIVYTLEPFEELVVNNDGYLVLNEGVETKFVLLKAVI